ncbi:DUF6455 family protein [Chachezhania sediminis]|uniref:DUF6455 family protein n=1 Tax=Chachezhania sediminis TaxID=2599291 RepID=UPI00131D58B1|nr:DUF6455 family protein [Chachezhania sediminis]
MSNRTVLKHHAELVDRMAHAVGVDLEEVVFRAQLDMSEVTDAVMACTGCTDPEGCQHWLKAHEGAVADAAPGYCRNRDLFADLAGDTA